MNDRRILPTIAGVVLAASLGLAGTAAHAADKKISIMTWNHPYLEEVMKGWTDAFHKIHPDVQVEWIDKKGTEWSTFYQTQVVAGTPPDIIDVQGGLWLEYASQGGLLDLTPYLKKDAAYSNGLVPEFLNNWVFEGKNYGVPLFVVKTLLFYNKNLFKQAGIANPPTTFDELMADAQKMTKGENSGLMTVNFDWLYWPFFAVNGIDMFTPDLKKAAFNTPKAVALVERLAKATKDGVINKISWTGRWVEPNGAFAAGTIGMLHAHATAYMWFKSNANWVNEDTVGAATFPGGWSTPNAQGLMISKGSKYPQEAWDFIKVATAGDGAYAFGDKLTILTGDKAANDKLMAHFQQSNPAIVPALKTQLADLDKLTGNWPVAKDAQVKEALYPELQAAFLGEKSAKEALDAAEQKVNRVLQRR